MTSGRERFSWVMIPRDAGCGLRDLLGGREDCDEQVGFGVALGGLGAVEGRVERDGRLFCVNDGVGLEEE